MISLLCPTRGRRDMLKQMVDSAYATAANPGALEVICYVDADDPTRDAYSAMMWPDRVRFIVGQRRVLSNLWNLCAAAAHGDIFQQSNDDIIFQTRGWDTMVESEFAKCPDRILVAHGSDGSEGASGKLGLFGVHPFVSRRWYEVLGYVTAPYFSSDYGDTWIHDLADALGRRRFLQFLIEHKHFYWGKGPIDQNTEDRLHRHSADNVGQVYQDLDVLRQIDIEKLKRVIA